MRTGESMMNLAWFVQHCLFGLQTALFRVLLVSTGVGVSLMSCQNCGNASSGGSVYRKLAGALLKNCLKRTYIGCVIYNCFKTCFASPTLRKTDCRVVGVVQDCRAFVLGE
jgi:hypothetical protein